MPAVGRPHTCCGVGGGCGGASGAAAASAAAGMALGSGFTCSPLNTSRCIEKHHLMGPLATILRFLCRLLQEGTPPMRCTGHRAEHCLP